MPERGRQRRRGRQPARSTISSTTGNTTAAATTGAQGAAIANPILSTALTSSQIAVQHGAYHYSYSSMTFTPQFPPVSPDNYNLTQATVTPSISSFFSRVFGLTSFNVQATATAAYRPRDVAIVLDFSGSMNNETDLWNCESYLGSMQNTPNNTDPVFPQWGVYKPGYSPTATFQCTSSDTRVGNCNITTTIGGITALVNDFYSNNRGGSAAGAFTAATTPTSTTPVGDTYLTTSKDTSTTPGRTIAEISGSTSLTNTNNKSFVSQGYKSYTGKTFNGYTEGPNYWGKTFFIWPPDQTNDWRKKFFLMPDGKTPVNDNTALWDSNGNWLTPTGNYIINYKAILNWIVNTGPNPFPSQLRSGNVLYYSAIPTDVPASAYTYSQSNSSIGNQDQRFWKEYIDFVIGVWQDPFGNTQVPGSSTCSYGPDFACGDGTGVSITGPDSSTKYNGTSFVAPTDNPLRPRHRFWFGPMTMIQYMLDTSISPGTFHDISMVPAKLGIAGAVTDIQNNHPNDMVSMIYYARPSYAGEPSAVGTFDNPIASLGRNYSSLISSLWYPPNSSSADVRPWDSNGDLVPRAHGDYCGNTATSYGLMLAYNQMSGNTSLQSSGMGGYGRKGAQRLVILETDGLANASTTASSSNAGATWAISTLARATAIRRARTIRTPTPSPSPIKSAQCTTTAATDCLAFPRRPSPSRFNALPSGRSTSPRPRRLTTRRGSRCCSRSRRSAVRPFPVRRAIRPMATSGASARSRSGKPSTAGFQHDHGQHRADRAGQVSFSRRGIAASAVGVRRSSMRGRALRPTHRLRPAADRKSARPEVLALKRLNVCWAMACRDRWGSLAEAEPTARESAGVLPRPGPWPRAAAFAGRDGPIGSTSASQPRPSSGGDCPWPAE